MAHGTAGHGPAEVRDTQNSHPASPSRREATLGMRGGLGKTLLTAFLLLAIVPLSLLAIVTYNQIENDTRHKVLAELATVASLEEAHLVDWVEGYEGQLALLAADLGGAYGLQSQAWLSQTQATALIVVGEEPAADQVLAGTAGTAGVKMPTADSLRSQDRRLAIVPPLSPGDEPLLAISYPLGPSAQAGASESGGQRWLVALLPREALGVANSLQSAPFGPLPSVPLPTVGTGGTIPGIVRNQDDSHSLRSQGGITTYLATREGLITLRGTGGGQPQPVELALALSGQHRSGDYAVVPPVPPVPTGGVGNATADGGRTSDGLPAAIAKHPEQSEWTEGRAAPVFGAYRWNADLQVALLAELPQAEALTAGSTLTAAMVAVTLAMALVTAAIAAVVTRQVTRPIVQLTETAARMAHGDLDQQVPVTRRDEIGVLARAFNRMASELRVLYGNLETKVIERTQQLEEAKEEARHHAVQLDISAEVARVATSIRDVDGLLTTAVGLIARSFELDHVAIYLVDGDQQDEGGGGRWSAGEGNSTPSDPLAFPAVGTGGALRNPLPAVPLPPAGTSGTIPGIVRTPSGPLPSVGMLRNRGALQALVEQAIATGQRQTAGGPATGGSAEAGRACRVAIPLRARGRVLGAMALCSDCSDTFERDQTVYQSLADQLSVAIDNARAYAMERETVKRLKELDRIQSQFLTNMSHALRTPLTSILGFSRLMLKEMDGPLTEMQQTDLTAIHEGGQQLLGLINDMLELTQLDLGTASFALAEIDLAEIVDGVMATAEALARGPAGTGERIRLVAEVPEDLPKLYTDGQRVRQVILALLSNAIKFTTEGSVRLTVAVMEGFPSGVKISVTDTGIGISPAEREAILNDRSDSEQGHDKQPGFGLAISRRVVEKLGGEIWIESEEGVGSTLTFTLPIHGEIEGEGR